MLEINLPDVVEEVLATFAAYEHALVVNDVAVLDAMFWRDPLAVRYGVRENLYGHAAIAEFRATQPVIDMRRALFNTVITTFGRAFATANTEFQRQGAALSGRQSQTWLKTAEGWRIVAAHVSLMPAPALVR